MKEMKEMTEMNPDKRMADYYESVLENEMQGDMLLDADTLYDKLAIVLVWIEMEERVAMLRAEGDNDEIY